MLRWAKKQKKAESFFPSFVQQQVNNKSSSLEYFPTMYTAILGYKNIASSIWKVIHLAEMGKQVNIAWQLANLVCILPTNSVDQIKS